MKKVFVDTNVLLDFILCREGEELASEVFDLGDKDKIALKVSYLTMANAAYVAKKHRTQEELQEYLTELSAIFEILPNDERQYHSALDKPVTDFEDYLQCKCAEAFNCDVIITNNVKHFKDTSLPVMTPLQFVAEFCIQQQESLGQPVVGARIVGREKGTRDLGT